MDGRAIALLLRRFLQFEDSRNSIAYRSDTGTVLGYFGPRRKPFQNREIVEAFHDFCASSGDGLQIERLGCLNSGKSLFATALLNHQIDVKKIGDVVETRLLLTEHHESGKALQIRVLFNRLVCTNGMTQLVKLKGRTLNHMKAFSAATVCDYLEAAYRNVEEHEKTLEQLAAIAIADSEARMHLIKAFGNPDLAWEEQPRPVQVCYKLFKGQGAGRREAVSLSDLVRLGRGCQRVPELVCQRELWRAGVQLSMSRQQESACEQVHSTACICSPVGNCELALFSLASPGFPGEAFLFAAQGGDEPCSYCL